MKLAQAVAHTTFPRESNNYKARLLHPLGLLVVVALFVLVQISLQIPTNPKYRILGYAANISSDEVIRLTNEKRVAAGLPALQANDTLFAAAEQKAKDMIENDYWAHVAPDGTEPWYFFSNSGYSYRYAGENLARDFSNPQAAVEAWMASPSHRDNLLSSKYRDIGIAVIEGDLAGADTTVVVQLFGTRAADTVPVVPIAAAQELGSSQVEEAFVKTGPIMSESIATPLDVSRYLSLGVIAVFIGVLAVDIVILRRRNVSRISSRPFAHLSFMGMILAIVLIVKAGQIL